MVLKDLGGVEPRHLGLSGIGDDLLGTNISSRFHDYHQGLRRRSKQCSRKMIDWKEGES